MSDTPDTGEVAPVMLCEHCWTQVLPEQESWVRLRYTYNDDGHVDMTEHWVHATCRLALMVDEAIADVTP